MRELGNILDLDVLTVTGKTLGENLADLEKSGYFYRCEAFLQNYRLKPSDIIRPVSAPVNQDSGLAVLRGNIAPEGAVVKHYALDEAMHHFIGQAMVFDSEEEAVEEIYADHIQPGDVVVLRYKGIHAAGMPEMAKVINAICNKPALDKCAALLTDGRFSGGSKGPCIGYIMPEAADNGPIGLLQNGDLIEIDIPGRSLNLIGFQGMRQEPEQVTQELSRRQTSFVAKKFQHRGAMKYVSVF